MLQAVISTFTALSLLGSGLASPGFMPEQQLLSEHTISLDKRQPDRFVNGVFKDNILLSLYYMRGEVKDPKNINWDEVRKPFHYEFVLKPSETFAFHEDVLPVYEGKVVKTTNAHFNGTDGFKSDGYLMGDGVCHLASLINWVAKDGNITSEALVNHNFARIEEISREYGVSIYYNPGSRLANAKQNLYVTNNFNHNLIFKFDYQNDNLKLGIYEQD